MVDTIAAKLKEAGIAQKTALLTVLNEFLTPMHGGIVIRYQKDLQDTVA
jgi:hypothetical protein